MLSPLALNMYKARWRMLRTAESWSRLTKEIQEVPNGRKRMGETVTSLGRANPPLEACKNRSQTSTALENLTHSDKSGKGTQEVEQGILFGTREP